jgi:hypothetical protein
MLVTIFVDSPLHHGAFDADSGNAIAFRRTPVAMLDGRHVLIPHVSGNALRGMMRRLLMCELLDICGVTPDVLEPRAYERLYAALVNGGHLDGSEMTITPAKRRALREALPPLSVLGASLYTYMLSGRCEVGLVWPVCHETVDVGIVAGHAHAHAEDLVTDYSHVRHIDREAHDPAVSGVTPMPMTMEVLIPGTVLVSRIGTRRCTEVEGSALAHAATKITTIGGKSASGLGRVRVDCDGNPGPYRQWLGEHRESARTALMDLAVEISTGKAKRAKA